MAQKPIDTYKVQNAVNTAAEIAVWTPAAGKKFRLCGLCLVSSVAGIITLRDGTGGTIIHRVPSGAGGTATFMDLKDGILSSAAGNALTATGPAASVMDGIIYGNEE